MEFIKPYIVTIVILMFSAFAKAQTTDPALLVKIQNASQAEIDAYTATDLELGMLVYNTDENRIFEYTNVGFVELLTQQNIYVGHFTITATGAQTITGIPFRPTQVTFQAYPNINNTTLNDDNAGAGNGNNNTTFVNAFGGMSGYARDTNGVISQQVIYVGGNGNSINDISRYANPGQCIGIRYSNQNGDNLGLTAASLTTMTTDGFTINVSNRTDNLVVLYTAYR